MGLTVNAGNGGDFEIVPEGTFIGRLYQMVELGTIEKTYKAGDTPKKVREVYIGFELLDESAVRKDGKPFTKGNSFTAIINSKSNLCKALESIRGRKFTEEELKKFELDKAMGAYCQISIVHAKGSDGNTYANIGSYAPLHKSMTKPDPVNANLVFDLDSKNVIGDLATLPKWMQERVQESDEWKSIGGNPVAGNANSAKQEVFEDEIPF